MPNSRNHDAPRVALPMLEAIATVSYTHLDVYKRQVFIDIMK